MWSSQLFLLRNICIIFVNNWFAFIMVFFDGVYFGLLFQECWPCFINKLNEKWKKLTLGGIGSTFLSRPFRYLEKFSLIIFLSVSLCALYIKGWDWIVLKSINFHLDKSWASCESASNNRSSFIMPPWVLRSRTTTNQFHVKAELSRFLG